MIRKRLHPPGGVVLGPGMVRPVLLPTGAPSAKPVDAGEEPPPAAGIIDDYSKDPISVPYLPLEVPPWYDTTITAGSICGTREDGILPLDTEPSITVDINIGGSGTLLYHNGSDGGTHGNYYGSYACEAIRDLKQDTDGNVTNALRVKILGLSTDPAGYTPIAIRLKDSVGASKNHFYVLQNAQSSFDTHGVAYVDFPLPRYEIYSVDTSDIVEILLQIYGESSGYIRPMLVEFAEISRVCSGVVLTSDPQLSTDGAGGPNNGVCV